MTLIDQKATVRRPTANKVRLHFDTNTGLISGTFPDGTKKSTGISFVAPPANPNSSGVVGQLASDGETLYICIAADTWIKVSIVGGWTGNGGGSALNTYVQGDMYYIDGTTLRIGVSLKYGGALYYIGDKNGNNLVNYHPTGRANGVSVYADPEPFSVSGYTTLNFPNASWNIVQDGADGGSPSRVVSYSFNPTTNEFTVNFKPLQWKFVEGYEDPSTTASVVYKFDDTTNSVKCSYSVRIVKNFSNSNGKANETGFSYWTRNLKFARTYIGASPFTGAATTDIVDGSFTYSAFGVPNTKAIFPDEPQSSANQEGWVWLCDNLSTPTKYIGIIKEDGRHARWQMTRYLSDTPATPTSNPCIICQNATNWNDTGDVTLTTVVHFVLDSSGATRALADSILN